MSDPLGAVSPLDGRYHGRTEPLSPYVSESALNRARVRVEVEYLIALADIDAIPLELDALERETLRACYETFDTDSAQLIKAIETEGYGPYPATNHDVKAVEYFIREQVPDDLPVAQWIHFGLTSEDVNNLSHRLLLKAATENVLRPAIADVREALVRMAEQYRELPMLARTHGQPATPTTFGKEMAVYADRLTRGLARLDQANEDLAGKLAGATGTYAAHHVAYPDVDWPAFAGTFVRTLGLEHVGLTTQVNPCDDLAALFDAYRTINRVLIDLDQDIWTYVSRRYLGQATDGDETGSSTMPHKVNPIDFENSEGNLSKANSDFVFLGDYVTTSRLQRDLSDSTVKRNIGTALAHALIGYNKTADGLAAVTPNERVMRDDLAAHPEVIAEAMQTVLRREGRDDAYEQVKAATRGESVSIDDLHDLVAELDISPAGTAQLEALTPETYTGIASELVDELSSSE